MNPAATTDPLAPFDAVMYVTYGGPNGPDDVLPFMRNATAGRGVPDDRLIEVAGHYQRFGGVSPINERNEELRAALAAELAARGSALPVVIGNRNWHPFIKDTLAALAAEGKRRILVLLASAYASYSGCRQYREDLGLAAAELAEAGIELTFAKARPYYTTPGFLAAATDATAAAWDDLVGGDSGSEDRAADYRIAFVTHSIPTSMNANAGPPDYVAQHLAVCEEIVARLHERFGYAPAWDLVYCSRSGPEHVPWLEPDINDHLSELAPGGAAGGDGAAGGATSGGGAVRGVVAVPMGFTSDHMEVVFDLDVEAAETAAELGLEYRRAATVGTDERFVSSLAHVVQEVAAAEQGQAVVAEPGDLGPWPARCRAGCCAAVRHPHAPAPRPTVCGAD